MCYEQRYFSQWGAKKAQKREEPKTETEQAVPSAQTVHPSTKAKQPEKVERELESV